MNEVGWFESVDPTVSPVETRPRVHCCARGRDHQQLNGITEARIVRICCEYVAD